MADVEVISGGVDVEDMEPLQEGAAHEAAVAQGAAQAHEEQAADHAERAELAASEAAAAVDGTTGAAMDAQTAAAEARDAASAATAAALAVAEGSQALASAISSFTEEMKASQVKEPAESKTAAPKADKPPAKAKKRLGSRYFG